MGDTGSILGMIATPQIANPVGSYLGGQQAAQSIRLNDQAIQQNNNALLDQERKRTYLDITAAYMMDGEQQMGMLNTILQGAKDPATQQAVKSLMSMQEEQRRPVMENIIKQYAGQYGPKQEAYTLAPGAARFQGGQMIGYNPAEAKTPNIGKTREIKKDGQIITQEYTATGWEQIAESPRWDPNAGTNITVNNDTSEGAFKKELGKTLASSFDEKRKSAQEAVASLQSVADARNLLEKGMITGFGAEFLTNFGSALQTLGYDYNVDKIQNTQAFVAAQGKQIAQIIQAFGAGTGLSDADREFAAKAAGGDITLTKGAIERILGINERAYQNIIANYNKEAEQLEQKYPGISPFSLRVDPGRTGQTDKAVPKVTTQAEFDALPSGAVYFENGQQYQKP